MYKNITVESKEITLLKEIMGIRETVAENASTLFDVKLYDIYTDKEIAKCKGYFFNSTIRLLSNSILWLFGGYKPERGTITVNPEDIRDVFKAKFRVKSYNNSIKEVVIPRVKISNETAFSLGYDTSILSIPIDMLYTPNSEIFSIINDDEWV